MPINWDPQIMKTGIDEIDAQHQGLFDALNKLYEAFNQGQGTEEIANILGFLGQYVIDHFSYEESLMKQHAYPNTEKQVFQHNGFIDDYKKLNQVFEQEGPTKKLMLTIYNDTYKWLVEHISGSDKDLGRFLTNKQ